LELATVSQNDFAMENQAEDSFTKSKSFGATHFVEDDFAPLPKSNDIDNDVADESF